MTTELINQWKTKVILLHTDIKLYIEIIDNVLKSDIDLIRDINKMLKEVEIDDNLFQKNITFNSTRMIFTNIGKIDHVSSILRQLVNLVTDPLHLKQIKSEMSDTYYKNIVARGKKISKEVDIIQNLIDEITQSVISNLDDNIVKNTHTSEFEQIYLNNLSKTSSLIFNKYLEVYNKYHINTQPILQKIYDYILGYNDEKLNDKPYSSHPLLLMGLSFNLSPHMDFINEDLIMKSTSGGIIKVNNKVNKSVSYTVYDINALLSGKYTTVIKKESINPNTVEYSKTIKLTPLLKKSRSYNIHNINIDNSAFSTIYESLDGGVHFRQMNKSLPTDNVRYIDKGPKPRVYLYNSNCMNIISSKPQVKLDKEITKPKEGYVDVTKLIKNKTLSSMYKEVTMVHKTNFTKNKERRLFEIFKSEIYLREIRKINTKVMSEVKIPFESPLVLNLF